MRQPVKKSRPASPLPRAYSGLVGGIGELLEAARRASAPTFNVFMTATYREVGRRIVEFEQAGERRAGYGDALLERLSKDLSSRYGRGFARPNLIRFRQFYLAFPSPPIRSTASNESAAAPKPIRSAAPNELETLENCQTRSGEMAAAGKRATTLLNSEETVIMQTASAQSETSGNWPTLSSNSATPSRKSLIEPSPLALADLARAFPLPWSHYVLLTSRSRSPEAFAFYHAEALRGGWSVRHLQRQMDSQFYERTALSRNKSAMLAKGATTQPGDAVSAEEEIRHPRPRPYSRSLCWGRDNRRRWRTVRGKDEPFGGRIERPVCRIHEAGNRNSKEPERAG